MELTNEKQKLELIKSIQSVFVDDIVECVSDHEKDKLVSHVYLIDAICKGGGFSIENTGQYQYLKQLIEILTNSGNTAHAAMITHITGFNAYHGKMTIRKQEFEKVMRHRRSMLIRELLTCADKHPNASISTLRDLKLAIAEYIEAETNLCELPDVDLKLVIDESKISISPTS